MQEQRQLLPNWEIAARNLLHKLSDAELKHSIAEGMIVDLQRECDDLRTQLARALERLDDLLDDEDDDSSDLGGEHDEEDASGITGIDVGTNDEPDIGRGDAQEGDD